MESITRRAGWYRVISLDLMSSIPIQSKSKMADICLRIPRRKSVLSRKLLADFAIIAKQITLNGNLINNSMSIADKLRNISETEAKKNKFHSCPVLA